MLVKMNVETDKQDSNNLSHARIVNEAFLREGSDVKQNRLSLFYIAVILLVMFGFGFALVPIYEFICDKTGLNGRSENLFELSERTVEPTEVPSGLAKITGQKDSTQFNHENVATAEAANVDNGIDESRSITIVFDGEVGGALPWSFKPVERKIVVHPGQAVQAVFIAENYGSATVVGQAVPQVSPVRASPYFEKTECFCFTEQELKAGEKREMPVYFVVDRNLPEFVDRIRLSYTFFVANDSLATKNKSASAVQQLNLY